MARALGKVLLVLGLVLTIISLFLDWLTGTTGLDVSQLNALGDYFGNFVANLQACGVFWCYLLELVPIFLLIGVVFCIVGIFTRLGLIGGIFLVLVVVVFLVWHLSLGPVLVGFGDLGLGAWIAVIGAFLALIGGIASAGKSTDEY